QMVIDQAVHATKGFFKVARALGASINEKLAIISSTKAISDEVSRRLQLDMKISLRSTAYLGTDVSGGRARNTKGARDKFRARQKVYGGRLKKLRKFKKVLAAKKTERIGKIYRVGARPAYTFGVEVNGVNDAELLKLRRDYNKHAKPNHGGISASAKMVLLGDPAATQALAPALQWSRMVWAATARSRKFNKYQKFCIMNCACDGVWTRQKAKEKGYLTDGKCECGDEDTLVHRLVDCTRPEVVEARCEAAIPDSFFQELRQAQDDRVVTQGAFAYPEWEIPDMQIGTGSVILDGDGNDFDCTPETMAATVLAETDLEMELSFDGSCTKPDIMELQRAGWAIALMDPHSDKVLCTMHAPVPASLPQSSAMAEYLAYACTGQVADRPADGYADFMGTVRMAALTHEQQLHSKSAHACVALFAQSLPGFHHLRSVTHVQAHRSGEEYACMDMATRRLTDANVYADVRAKAGAAMHAPISEDFAKAIDTASVRIKNFAKLVAAVLPLFDRDAHERWTRRTAQIKRIRSTRTDGWHQWEEGNFGLQCKACLKINCPGTEVMLNGCAGAPTFLKAFLNQPLGHHLVAVNQKGDGLSDEAVPTVLVCAGCGAWAQQRRRQKL
ncbi:unnamed protein product, partial [Prorocentrum cordatum]